MGYSYLGCANGLLYIFEEIYFKFEFCETVMEEEERRTQGAYDARKRY